MSKDQLAESREALVPGSYVFPPGEFRWHMISAGPDHDGRIVLVEAHGAELIERNIAAWSFPVPWRPATARPAAFTPTSLRRQAMRSGDRGRYLIDREERLLDLADDLADEEPSADDDGTISRQLVEATLRFSVVGGAGNLREHYQPSIDAQSAGFGAEMRTREIAQFAACLMRRAGYRADSTVATRKVTLMVHRAELDPKDNQRVVLFFPHWSLVDDSDADA